MNSFGHILSLSHKTTKFLQTFFIGIIYFLPQYFVCLLFCYHLAKILYQILYQILLNFLVYQGNLKSFKIIPFLYPQSVESF